MLCWIMFEVCCYIVLCCLVLRCFVWFMLCYVKARDVTVLLCSIAQSLHLLRSEANDWGFGVSMFDACIYAIICQYMSAYIIMCHYIPVHAIISQYMSAYIIMCYYIPVYAIISQYMSAYIIMFHYIPVYAIISQYMSAYIIMCHYIPVYASLCQ